MSGTPVLEDVNESSTRSVIVLGISAHGTDLCKKLKRDNNDHTLFLTIANKNEAAYDFKCYRNIDKIKDLYKSLNKNKQKIDSVISGFIGRSSMKSNNKNYSLRSSDADDLYNEKTDRAFAELTAMTAQTKLNNENMPENNSLSRNVKKTATAVNNSIIHALEAYNTSKKQSAAFNKSCQKGMTAQARVIENDRKYNMHPGTEEDTDFGIYILDIRNPKSAKQNNIEEIADTLNNENEFKTLSGILDDCYKTFGFDYVTIIDFACRNSEEETESCNENCSLGNICGNCTASEKEMKEGKKRLRVFRSLRLGGKKRKRRTRRRIKLNKNRRFTE